MVWPLAFVILRQSETPASNRTLPTGPEVIRKMKEAIRAATPIAGTVKGSGTVFKAAWPDLLWMRSADKHSALEYHWYNGMSFLLMKTGGETTCLKGNMENFMMPAELMLKPYESAFSHANIYDSPKNVRMTTFEKKPALTVDVITPEEAGPEEDTLFLDPKTYLPLGYDSFYGEKERVIFQMKYHANLKSADFVWHPPKGVKVTLHNVPRKYLPKDWNPPEVAKLRIPDGKH